MNAYSPCEDCPRPLFRPAPFKQFLLTALLCLLAVLMLKTVYDHSHGVQAHGDEALRTRTCINQYGAKVIFEQKDGKLHRFCVDPNTHEIYDQIVEYVNGKLSEITAMKPTPYFGANSWENIYTWLTGKSGKLFIFDGKNFVEVTLSVIRTLEQ